MKNHIYKKWSLPSFAIAAIVIYTFMLFTSKGLKVISQLKYYQNLLESQRKSRNHFIYEEINVSDHISILTIMKSSKLRRKM